MLRQWRVLTGKTQGEAGALVGVPQATWSRWESGVLIPSLATVKRIGALTDGSLTVAEMIEASDLAPRKAG
jgi:transcriptional regulator with XRE-family HTH domain